MGLGASADKLQERRARLDTEWHRFVADGGSPMDQIRLDIAGSWQRSVDNITPRLAEAPCLAQDRAIESWQASALRTAAQGEVATLQHMAQDGDFVMAIADPAGHLLWTCASRHMENRAEEVNFITGGRWDEDSVGTNAVGLALRLKQPTTVFSSEHFLPVVHDWVCYGAPIIHPQTGRVAGVLDISTTWNRHTPLGQAAVAQMARSIAAHLPDEQPRAELEIHVLGAPRIVFRGKEVRLPQRQIELLCLLALHPDGLKLDECHARLYGDAQVSLNTLKAEISHLRRTLDGQIGSRPYRLTGTVWADFLEVWQLLQARKLEPALSLFRGPLLTGSSSPELEEWRYCLDAVMDEALSARDNLQELLTDCSMTHGGNLIRERLAEMTLGF